MIYGVLKCIESQRLKPFHTTLFPLPERCLGSLSFSMYVFLYYVSVMCLMYLAIFMSIFVQNIHVLHQPFGSVDQNVILNNIFSIVRK